MEHNLPLYRANIIQSPSYAACPGFIPALGWRTDKAGHVLVNKSSNENAVVSVIGRVLELRLDCGPTGNFIKGRFGGLQTAKYHCLLEKPDKTPFANDFDNSLSNFERVQSDIASTANKNNFIVVDGQQKHLRFTKYVFEKRERALEGSYSICVAAQLLRISIFTDNGAVENEVDDETENWPVPVELRGDLDNIKRTYRANPLRVFARDAFVEARNVNDVIRGALVEMHFELNHYCIRGKNQDSFNAHIQQIQVLQPGKPRPLNAYKRKNVRDGPIRLCPALNVATLNSSASAPPGGAVRSEQNLNENAFASGSGTNNRQENCK